MTAETWDVSAPGTTPDPCTDPRCAAARHTAADRDERQRHHANDLEADNARLRRENAALRRQRLAIQAACAAPFDTHAGDAVLIARIHAAMPGEAT